MEIKDLKGNEICNIIKACSSGGVKKFSLGDMSIEFTQDADEAVGIPYTPPAPGTEVEVVKRMAMSDADRELLEELEDTQVMIDDPVQWEQNIADSHITGGVVHGSYERSQTESDLQGI